MSEGAANSQGAVDRRPPALFLMGPTASGKTAAAMELTKRFPAEIVSVDSAMVYRGMDIGTAKPNSEELVLAPHRLIDICDPAEAYSAARFCTDALAAMTDITRAGKIPLLAGGTMLYFKALAQGLADMPDADPIIRARLSDELERLGSGVLHQRLQQIDPASAERIHPNDPQRLLRALEVYEVSGTTLTALHNRQTAEAFPYRVLNLALAPEQRSALHRRIETRFDTMLSDGLVDEVERLYLRGDLHADLPAIKSVGYRQIWQHLDGQLSLDEARERAIIATRQLGKRQMTWLRSWKSVNWFNVLDKNAFALLNQVVERFLPSE